MLQAQGCAGATTKLQEAILHCEAARMPAWVQVSRAMQEQLPRESHKEVVSEIRPFTSRLFDLGNRLLNSKLFLSRKPSRQFTSLEVYSLLFPLD